MKLYSIFLLLAVPLFLHMQEVEPLETNNSPDTQELIGLWQLDMSPENENDNNFAMMRITEVKGRTFKGSFYRDGVVIQKGQLNTQRGIIYGALVSGDNSGDYNSTFYYEDGVLYGSTHALDRNFLSVWTAKKIEK